MPKNKSHPEFYIAYHTGLTPKDLIALGFNKWSAYNYFRRYNRFIKPAFIEILKKQSTPHNPGLNGDERESHTGADTTF